MVNDMLIKYTIQVPSTVHSFGISIPSPTPVVSVKKSRVTPGPFLDDSPELESVSNKKNPTSPCLKSPLNLKSLAIAGRFGVRERHEQYADLANCLYATYVDWQSRDFVERDRFENEVINHLLGLGYGVQQNTHFSRHIAKAYVVGEQRKPNDTRKIYSKASCYGIVIAKAYSEGVRVSDFSMWLLRNGGIDKIRLS